MKDEQDFVVPLAANDLEGLPDFVIASAKQAAIDAKSSHEYCINLSRSIVTPFLYFLLAVIYVNKYLKNGPNVVNFLLNVTTN